MNSTLLRFFCMILLGAGLYRAEAQCQYQLDLFDSFGDGWNGGSVKIVNGPNIYTFTLDNFSDDGMDSTVYFTVTAGLPLQLSWSPGFFVSEVSFKLYNTDNTLLYQSGVLGNSPVSLYSTIAACPSCLKPTNVQIENVYDTKAKLRWSPAPASSAIGWRVIYGPQGFVPGPGVGDTAFVTTPKVTLTGLQKKTGYDFYVVQQCDTTDFSAKVGPFSFETYWTNDVGISAVLSPVSSCALGQEAIKVVLTNYGAAPQTLLPFRYTVNGIDGGVQQPDDGFFTGVLGKDSSTVIEFETTFDFSEPGEYIIAVFTELTGDEESLNDTTYYRINNRLLAPYQQNFESWDGGWSVDTASVNPSWAFGDPEKFDLDTAASGVNAWLTSLDGLYNANEKSYLDSPCFDFSDLTTDPSIQFSLFYSTEANYDGGWLEMSLDGGTTWAKVGMQNEGLNWYNNTSSELGDVWDGQSGGWLQAQHRLPAAAGKSEVRLRFAMQADNFLSYSGLGIDDVRIFVTPANDLAALNVNTLGDADECGLAADSVTLRFTNLGTEPKSLFQVAYSLNGGQPVIETLGATIVVAPDEQFTYTFATPFDSRNGKFDIVGWTKLAGEQNFSNDTTAVYTVDHIPEPLPFKEDFEEGNFALPDGWYSTGFVTNFSNNISYVLEQNLYQFNTNYTTLLPRFGLVGADDSLRFDYRITDYPEGTDPTFLSNTVFEVQVSADCGPFETIYTIDSTTHIPSADLRTISLPLGQYVGKTIQIQFQGTWGEGDFFFDLDNVNLRACALDLDLTATVTPAAVGQSNGSATVEAGAGIAPFAYLWSTGDTTQTVENLVIGEYIVTVTDAEGCTAALTINIGNSGTGEIPGLTQFALQPNPTDGLALLIATFEQPVDARIEVVNLLGQRIWWTNVEKVSTLTQDLDLSSVANGIYLVRLTVGGQTLTKKIVKNEN